MIFYFFAVVMGVFPVALFSLFIVFFSTLSLTLHFVSLSSSLFLTAQEWFYISCRTSRIRCQGTYVRTKYLKHEITHSHCSLILILNPFTTFLFTVYSIHILVYFEILLKSHLKLVCLCVCTCLCVCVAGEYGERTRCHKSA